MHILFAITGDIRYNSRGLKQLRLLSGMGYTVTVVGLADTEFVEQFDERVTFHFLSRPPGGGPVFFRKCHRLFKSFAERNAEKNEVQVYHASDLYNFPAMAQAAKKYSGKLVYDARERYPYVAASANRPWVRWFWEFMEGRWIKNADVVFTVSERIASHIAASYNIELPEVLFNVPAKRERVVSNLLREELDVAEDQILILHQGKMQKDRGCLLLARAMQHVEGATLVFLGDGPLKQAIQAEITTLGISDRVRFRDTVSPADLHAYTCSADIGVTLLEDTCLNHRYALPNKLFEYLMAGVPVLASDLPEMGRLVEKYDVGRIVYPSDPVEVAKVLQEMVDAPADRKRWSDTTSAVLETFNWENASQVFRRNYKNLISTRSN